MDGRVQEPLREWMKAKYNVRYIDTITRPGIDKIIHDNRDTDTIREMAAISINAHHASVIVISGHHQCAGNPVSKEEHIRHVKNSVQIVQSWNLGVQVAGVWVNEEWKVEQIV